MHDSINEKSCFSGVLVLFQIIPKKPIPVKWLLTTMKHRGRGKWYKLVALVAFFS